MSVDAYMNPDFTWVKKGLFLLTALGGLALCTLLIFLWAKMAASEKKNQRIGENTPFHNYIELFYEMIIIVPILFFLGMHEILDTCTYRNTINIFLVVKIFEIYTHEAQIQ